MISTLGECEICCVAAAKYKCPRCESRTCSLACVKQHKNTSGQSCPVLGGGGGGGPNPVHGFDYQNFNILLVEKKFFISKLQ